MLKKYTIRPIVTGHIPNYPKLYYYHHSVLKYYPQVGDDLVNNPCMCFLVEGEGGFKCLVDTGMAETSRSSDYHHKGSVQLPGESILEQLEKLQIKPDEIDMVIFTHLHWDHVFFMDAFTKARFIANQAEYQFAMNPIPLYHKSYEYPTQGVVRPFEGIHFETVSGETEIMDGIRVFDTPGHSPGHIAVEIDTKDGAYIIGGDAAFVMDNFNAIPEIHYNVTPPARFANIIECWKSLETIKDRAIDLDHILLTHDVHLEEKCKSTPVIG